MNLHTLIRATALSGLLLAGSTNAAGLLTPANSNLPALEIRQHHVNVTIADGYSTTEIEQVFHNPHTQALDAVYSFPVPAKAAVGEFTYWINGQPVHGEVVEKQRAREIYESEKQAGRNTALVEQDSYKTFDISVASLQPASDVRIRLVYLQPAQIDSGIGRYLYPLEEGGVDEQKLAFWHRNEAVTEQFSFNLKLRSSYPIDSVRLPQHPQAQVSRLNEQEWQISLSNQHTPAEGQRSAAVAPVAALDKDIVLYWRHAQGLPGSLDLISYRKDEQSPGTFMLTLTPGDDLAPLTQGRDWVFILDVSGSMSHKFATLVDGVRQALGKLPAQDRLRIVLFNDRAHDFSNGFQPVTEAGTLLNRLEQYQPDRGTNLYAGLELGLKQLDSDRTSALVLVTDGVANVGVTEKKRFLKLLEDADLRLFTFIMGNSANRPMLEEMTEVSQGFAMAVSNADDMMGHIMLAADKLTHQALRDLKLELDGGRITDLTPQQPGTLYRGQQLTLFGHYRKAGPLEVTLSGNVGGETRRYHTRIELPAYNDTYPELERLWALAAIEQHQKQQDYLGENADSRQAITELATEYGLVTDYTSMIVVEEARFQALNIGRSNHDRVTTEQNARAARTAQPVASHRADAQQPMFNAPRATPSGNGAGSVGPWLALLILALLVIAARQARDEQE